jgi:DNA-binding response OmpR family regulator
MNNNNSVQNRILLVDDEPDITIVFTLGLKDNCFKVDAFNDPLPALSDFKNGLYDLVLIDYKMPNMNGFELHREIKKIDEEIKGSRRNFRKVPIRHHGNNGNKEKM